MHAGTPVDAETGGCTRIRPRTTKAPLPEPGRGASCCAASDPGPPALRSIRVHPRPTALISLNTDRLHRQSQSRHAALPVAAVLEGEGAAVGLGDLAAQHEADARSV